MFKSVGSQLCFRQCVATKRVVRPAPNN